MLFGKDCEFITNASLSWKNIYVVCWTLPERWHSTASLASTTLGKQCSQLWEVWITQSISPQKFPLVNGMLNDCHVRLTLSRGTKVTSSMNPLFNIFGCVLLVVPEWKPVGNQATYNNQTGIKLITSYNRRNTPSCLDSKIHHCNLINNSPPSSPFPVWSNLCNSHSKDPSKPNRGSWCSDARHWGICFGNKCHECIHGEKWKDLYSQRRYLSTRSRFCHNENLIPPRDHSSDSDWSCGESFRGCSCWAAKNFVSWISHCRWGVYFRNNGRTHTSRRDRWQKDWERKSPDHQID